MPLGVSLQSSCLPSDQRGLGGVSAPVGKPCPTGAVRPPPLPHSPRCSVPSVAAEAPEFSPSLSHTRGSWMNRPARAWSSAGEASSRMYFAQLAPEAAAAAHRGSGWSWSYRTRGMWRTDGGKTHVHRRLQPQKAIPVGRENRNTNKGETRLSSAAKFGGTKWRYSAVQTNCGNATWDKDMLRDNITIHSLLLSPILVYSLLSALCFNLFCVFSFAALFTHYPVYPVLIYSILLFY